MKYEKLTATAKFVVKQFNTMADDATLVVIIDSENIPELVPSDFKDMFCEFSGIRTLYGMHIKVGGKAIYFYSTNAQTYAGHSGHSIVVTVGEMSKKAEAASQSISIHKRWSSYVADLTDDMVIAQCQQNGLKALYFEPINSALARMQCGDCEKHK